jgi:hypothetical protein
MRKLVLQMGISIDGYVSGGPHEDIGSGEPEHPDVVARKLAWVTQAGTNQAATSFVYGGFTFAQALTRAGEKSLDHRRRVGDQLFRGRIR